MEEEVERLTKACDPAGIAGFIVEAAARQRALERLLLGLLLKDRISQGEYEEASHGLHDRLAHARRRLIEGCECRAKRWAGAG
jgi:hypothetical protein